MQSTILRADPLHVSITRIIDSSDTLLIPLSISILFAKGNHLTLVAALKGMQWQRSMTPFSISVNRLVVIIKIVSEIFINDFEFCPHHPNGSIKKYTKNCKCRKPNNLMIKKLQKRWPINLKKSFFIGDNISDKVCAEKSNLKYLNYTKNLFNRIKP